MSDYHIPVMLKETISALQIKKGHWYIDCNLGGGGHTAGILEAGGNVLGIDLDSDAIKEVSRNLKKYIDEGRLKLFQGNFSQIDKAVAESIHLSPTLSSKERELSTENNPLALKGEGQGEGYKKVSGVLFDLGVSTHQLEEAERGFSFNADAPLDMRMDNTKGVSAKDLVNGLYEKELAELFWKLGEENFSKPIARAIVGYREKKSIETTNELAQIILSVRRRSPADRTHPATRIFQALRIAVNDELNSLKDALPNAFSVLEKGGKIVVISFHSLEDRIVKNYFKELEMKKLGKIITDKPIETSEEEANWNPRSRSAKLRIIEKL